MWKWRLLCILNSVIFISATWSIALTRTVDINEVEK